MRTSQQIATEIEERFGFFPPFFAPALDTPQVLENLWQQTLTAYIDNPLPSQFKEKLSAYLSRFCPVSYCLVCHSCSLRSLGMQAREILMFLENSPPNRQEVNEHLRFLSAQNELFSIVSQLNSVLEESLLNCSIFIALNADATEDCQQELRRLLGVENYQYLVTFIAYVKTCHVWMAAHPEVTYKADKRAQDYLETLVTEEPELASFFNNYWDRIKHEQLGYARGLSTAVLSTTESLPFAQAIASASEGVLLTDPNQPDNPIIYANPAFSKLTGYSLEEVMGLNCRFLQGADTDRQAVEQLRQAIQQQQEIQVTLLNYRKDGQPFWNELKIAPVRSDTGDLLYFVGIQTDVTTRAQTEVQMQEQATLLEQSQDAILVLNLDHQILFWNSSASRLFGIPANQAIGRYVDELLFQECAATLQAAQASVISQGEWRGELQHQKTDGQRLAIDSRWTLIGDLAGNPKSILLTSTNVTERKQTEVQRQRIQRFESISTVASGMAHDLNNALAPVLLAIQLLTDKLLDEQSQQLLRTLEANTRRSAEIVQQVLSFVQGTKGEKSTVQVSQLLAEVETTAKLKLPRNVLMRVTLEAELWPICGNQAQLQQVILNLCENAQDAMLEGGVLRLSAKNVQVDASLTRLHYDAKVGPYVLIAVADTGVGIPPECLDRIFEPFFTTKEFGKGAGLGLSMVAGIVRGHGGFVNVQSQVGQGTEIQVYLPAQLFQVSDCGSILVVEPDQTTRQVAQTILKQAGYPVLSAQDGVEAIAQYAQHHTQITAVLVNLHIPDLDGITVIQALQRINSQVVVLVVDSFKLSDRLDEAIKASIRAFLTEPYTAETLLLTLQDAIASNPDTPER